MLESEQADRAEAETGRLWEQTGCYLGGCLYPAGQHACTCHSISRSWRGPSEELILLMCQPARRREGGRLDAALSSIQNNDASSRSVITVAAAHRGHYAMLRPVRPSVRPSVCLSVTYRLLPFRFPPFPLLHLLPPYHLFLFCSPHSCLFSFPLPSSSSHTLFTPLFPFLIFCPHHSDLLV